MRFFGKDNLSFLADQAKEVWHTRGKSPNALLDEIYAITAERDRLKKRIVELELRPTAPSTELVSDTTGKLIDMLRQRDTKGRVKYGVTLDRGDLSSQEWLQHLTEELLDAAGYAQALLRKPPSPTEGKEETK